jgi:hypothetical protein
MADDGVTAKPSKADASPNAHSVSAFKNGGFVKLQLSFGRKASIKAGTTNRALVVWYWVRDALNLPENILGLEMSSKALQQLMVCNFLFHGVVLHIVFLMVKREHDEASCGRSWMMGLQFDWCQCQDDLIQEVHEGHLAST